MWNQRYGAEAYAYGTEPNEFFRTALDGLPRPGRILLPAEGEGRNAVYAAGRGWQVNAYDQSVAGRDKAMRLAKERGVSIRYEVAGHANAQIETGAYDAAALIFAHVHESQRRAVHQRVCTALAPGGILLLEAYSKAQLDFGTGGPPVAELLYSLDAVREDFAALTIDSIEQIEAEILEGQFHHGRGSVIRVRAHRP